MKVSHQPGQFGVWIGVVLMAIGLVIAFYTQHVRIWAAIIDDGKGGKLLWVGGTTNKNRDRFQAKFEQIKTALQEELGGTAAKADQKNRREDADQGLEPRVNAGVIKLCQKHEWNSSGQPVEPPCWFW